MGMIIVFADDQTVALLPDIASVRTECEAVDVESGTYLFFDELGRRLIPRFTSPVRWTSLPFGVKSVGGGEFELIWILKIRGQLLKRHWLMSSRSNRIAGLQILRIWQGMLPKPAKETKSNLASSPTAGMNK